MGGQSIMEAVLGMVRSCEENYKQLQDGGVFKSMSRHCAMLDFRTVAYRLPRRCGHTTAAMLLQEELENACILRTKERQDLRCSDCFTLRAVSDGKMRGRQWDYVIVDNWSTLSPMDRGFIQEFCLVQHELPILILLG